MFTNEWSVITMFWSISCSVIAHEYIDEVTDVHGWLPWAYVTSFQSHVRTVQPCKRAKFFLWG